MKPTLRLDIPSDFFLSEVRCGYAISAEMKKVWSIELDLLNELIRVLDKYSLPYVAFGGTLLGAIRHSGMIPWDDDIDIAMRRADYDKLRIISKKEFGGRYFYQDEYSDPGSLTGHARIMNIETTAINRYHQQPSQGKCAFRQGIFVDIFALDNIPDDHDEQEFFINKVWEKGKTAWDSSKKQNRGLNTIVDSSKASGLLFKEYEVFCGSFNKVLTKQSVTFAIGAKNLFRYSFMNEELNKTELHNFEMLKIRVPSNYNAFLNRCYGEWSHFIKGTALHGGEGDILFDSERSYDQYLFGELNPILKKHWQND